MRPEIEKFIENPVVRSYLFYTGVLTLKMMIMSPLTIRQRLKNNVCILYTTLL